MAPRFNAELPVKARQTEIGQSDRNAWIKAVVQPRPEVMALEIDTHGGIDPVELMRLGLRPEDVLDFSVNTNAYGPPPGVIKVLAAVDVTRYPDRRATALRRAIAAREGIAEGQVLIGNGAAQLIWLAALAYLRPRDRVLIIGPTFGEYRVASQLMGAEVTLWRADPDRDFALDLDDLARALAACNPRLVWLCNPNNPTGIYLPLDALQKLRAMAPGALWVIDEAYRPFVVEPWPSLPLIEEGNVILLRSLTKDGALPGLRLGYALAAPPVIEALARVQPPWSVNAMAQAAGLAVLDGGDHLAHTIAILRRDTVALREALMAQGWRVLPTATHFFLVEVGDAKAICQRLLREHRIHVRDGTSFGLPAFIRIATRRPEENARLVNAMEAMRCLPGR